MTILDDKAFADLPKQFADAYREGAHGATLDADAARDVAISIDRLIASRDEWMQAAQVEANLRREFKETADSLQQTFDLQWEADMRAVARWRAAHPGNELVLPDRANMVVWLLEEHDRLIADRDAYKQSLDVLGEKINDDALSKLPKLRERESRISNEAHAAGRTKAGNDIGGL